MCAAPWLIAGATMAFSSVSVVTNSLRLRPARLPSIKVRERSRP